MGRPERRALPRIACAGGLARVPNTGTLSRPNILQVPLDPDSLAQLKRSALSMGLKPATFARLLLVQALKTPYAPIFPVRPTKKANRP
jgi:hypothetical protein